MSAFPLKLVMRKPHHRKNLILPIIFNLVSPTDSACFLRRLLLEDRTRGLLGEGVSGLLLADEEDFLEFRRCVIFSSRMDAILTGLV